MSNNSINTNRCGNSDGVEYDEEAAKEHYLRMLRALHGYGDADPVEEFEAYRAECRRARESGDLPDHVHVPDPDTIKMPKSPSAARAETGHQNKE